MDDTLQNTLQVNGYAITDNLYSDTEIQKIISCIENNQKENDAFLRTNNLFAIRQLLMNVPQLKTYLFNSKLKTLLNNLFEDDYFLTKAIYFDKPKTSNWFVAYHQDLSIPVSEKNNVDGYINWTYKKGVYGVQPPTDILEDIVTVRIHLDDTTAENGALRVIPKSHHKGIYRPETIDWNIEIEETCEVQKGSLMLMKPLLMHASNRTTNNKQRRVIHLEFCSKELTKPLEWLECLQFNN